VVSDFGQNLPYKVLIRQDDQTLTSSLNEAGCDGPKPGKRFSINPLTHNFHRVRMVTMDQLVDRSLGQEFSFSNNPNPVANHLDIGEDMRAEEHRLAAFTKIQDYITHLLASDRI
jgi:hypothetical protein